MKKILILFLCKTGRPLLELDEEERGGWGWVNHLFCNHCLEWAGRGEGYTGYSA